ncbi:MAG TPA: MarP family serine protease [Acidimicrobiales bacterium]|nr:MarP family serine protease [Acidimicrobiales bacterium]
MNQLDLIVLVMLVAAAVGGWRLGFLARVFSWFGLGLGVVLASQLMPTALRAVSNSDAAYRAGVAVLILLGGAFAGQALGLMVGLRIHRVLPIGPVRIVDRSVGAALGAFGVLLSFWLFMLPWLVDLPGWPAQQARSSSLAHLVDKYAPPAPDRMQALRRLIGDHDFPEVFDKLGPAPETGPPPSETGFAPGVQERIEQSTVKIEGEACKRIQEGSGFAIAADLVSTNAHVVAGVRSPIVMKPDGRRLPATLVYFDPDRDIAFLSVRNLNQTALPLAPAKVNDRGAVFGHPGGQDKLRVAPARINSEVTARGRDLYDSHRTDRDVFVLASTLHPGDSGAALTDLQGRVTGMAFAIAPDQPNTAYALTAKELQTALAGPRVAGTASGPCLSNG